MDASDLEKIGLSANESKVYLALLKLGSASAGLIADKSEVHRVNVYDALRRLMNKGLVSSVFKAEKKIFEAAPPENILLLIEKKEKSLSDIKARVPELMMDYKKTAKETQEVRNYKGKRGIITIYENMISVLNEGEFILSLGTTGTMRDLLKYWIDDWTRRRVEKGIKVKSIYYETARNLPKFKLLERRFIPQRMGYMPVTTYIYGGRVAIISFEELLGVEIQSQKIANSYRKYFEWWWNISEK